MRFLIRVTGLAVLIGALSASGCTINTTTGGSTADAPATSGGEEAKADKPKKKKKKKPAKEKPREEQAEVKPKPDKPKPDKPKDDKPKADKPKDEPKKDEPVAAKPPKEEPAPVDKPAPQPEQSKIVLPVKIALDAIEKELDGLVPQNDEKDWAQVTDGNDSPKAELKYELWRDPIKIELEGHTFHITVPVRYAATIRAQAKNPLTKDWFWIAKSETWGTREEPQRITAHFEATVAVADDWHIKSDLKLVKLEHGDAPSGDICKNAGIKICVSKSSIAPRVRDGIDKRLEPKLRKALEKLDGKVEHAFDLQKRAAKVWSAIQVPQALPGTNDTAWLVVRPSEVGVSRPSKDGSDVRVDLAIEGRLSVESGKKPKVTAQPLPKLSKVEGEPGFHVIAKLEVPREALGASFERALKGLSVKGTKLTVVRAQVVASADKEHPRAFTVVVAFGEGTDEIALELHGELEYDAARQRVAVDDFALSPESKKRAEAKLPGFDFDAFDKQVAAKARWDLRDEASPLRKAIAAALDKSLEGQASLRGELKQLDVQGLEITEKALEAKVIVGGALEVEVKR